MPLVICGGLLYMVAGWLKSLADCYRLDLRSLALFRIGLALMVLHALWGNWGGAGIWLAIALPATLLMLVGYRTRWATVVAWAALVGLHHGLPGSDTTGQYLLRTGLFWGMFLPLGSAYSIDQALNVSPQPQPQQIFTGATGVLMVQPFYFYGMADAIASPMLHWASLLLLWSPFKAHLCRTVAVIGFISFHGLGAIGTSSLDPTVHLLCCITWLAFIPHLVWDAMAQRVFTPQQRGLKIYYDADCGFCKKVVHLLRTFLVLPDTVPLQTAQSDPVIQTAMETHNSWVIVDWQGRHHYKWYGIAYVVSLSPILWPLAGVLRIPPLMALGNRIYEAIANNRQFAGNFTKPFKFQSFTVRSWGALSLIAGLVFLLILLGNLATIHPLRYLIQAVALEQPQGTHYLPIQIP